jgi:hypothetical protein
MIVTLKAQAGANFLFFTQRSRTILGRSFPLAGYSVAVVSKFSKKIGIQSRNKLDPRNDFVRQSSVIRKKEIRRSLGSTR